MGSCLSIPDDQPPARPPAKYVVTSPVSSVPPPSYPPAYTYASMPYQQQPQPSAPAYDPIQYKNQTTAYPYATPVYQYYQTTGGNPQVVVPSHYLPPNYYNQPYRQQPQQTSGVGSFVTGMVAGAVVADILDDISDP